jgi:hypothetical protein
MKRKLLLILGLLLLTLSLAGVQGCGSQDANKDGDKPARSKLETVKPNEDDGVIYHTTKEFVQALVTDDRQKILSMLTSEHRNTWEDESYLITEEAKSQYDEFTVENLQHTVVKYINNEDTNFENTGMVFAVYDVIMKKDGQEQGRVKIQESLVFRQENEKWLITLNDRGFLIEKN